MTATTPETPRTADSPSTLRRPSGARLHTAARIAVFCATLSMVACRGPHIRPIPPEEIGAHGTGTFGAPPERVFTACIEALTANGYTVARQDASRGLIMTEPRQARTGALSSDTDLYLRRYEIAVRATSGGGGEVEARPILAEARRSRAGTTTPRDRGVETAWTLDHERAEWRRLFSAVQRRLAAATTPPAPRAPGEAQ